MAVAVGNHLPGGGLKHSGLTRRCRFHSFAHPDLLELPSLSPPLFHRSRSTPCFSSSSSYDDPIARIKILGCRTSPSIRALVAEAAVAMAIGARFYPTISGLGGAYFLRGPSGNCLAVLKPVVDKPAALFIPNQYSSHLCVRSGDTCVREAAAYLLDHAEFAGVPPTALIRISHPDFSGAPASRVASIQRFVPHNFDAGDLGPSIFSVASVHRIGILDIRLLNTDRHAGNLLIQKKNMSMNYKEEAAELVPIDHGLCLPEFLDDPYFEWLHWPQAAVPFSDLEAEYVSKLDPFKDAELLRDELPSVREPAIRILILYTIFLKGAVSAGLCLADIGGMMTREFCRLEEGMSTLEELCWKTEESMLNDNHFCGLDRGYTKDENEGKEIQFAIDCEEDDIKAADEGVVEIPRLLQIARNKSLDILLREEGDEQDNVKEEREKEKEGGVLTKSVSFSVGELSCDGHGFKGSKATPFVNMNDENWGDFLVRFQQLLPEAFEVRKCMEMKHRLGSSCRF